MNNNIYEELENSIINSEINEADKNKFLKNIIKLKEQKINIMITGSTGCGKSSTINALFNEERAKVGMGVDPETMEIEKYELGNLILWDTPGLGDGKEKDNHHAKNIINKLTELDKDGNALIDMVLVIVDGGSRDLGTSYELINNVIIPNLGKNKEKRILVAINQADMAMKGRNWDYENNRPNKVLENFLDEKVTSIHNRILASTGVNVTPIYYSAGYKEAGEEQSPYNLSKLLYYIVQATPAQKRAVYVDKINQNKEVWKSNDELLDYGKKTRQSMLNSLVESISDGAATGANILGDIGSVFGEVGENVGRFVGTVSGGVIGGVKGIVTGIADRVFSKFF